MYVFNCLLRLPEIFCDKNIQHDILDNPTKLQYSLCLSGTMRILMLAPLGVFMAYDLGWTFTQTTICTNAKDLSQNLLFYLFIQFVGSQAALYPWRAMSTIVHTGKCSK